MPNTTATKSNPVDKPSQADIEYLKINEEGFYKISNSNTLGPFFMSIICDSNHWMFISSNGGLTAGRKNVQYALFPYYTDDKITESTEFTGSKTIFRINRDDQTLLWEPFSNESDNLYRISRNLYKNVYGNKIIFEEVNHDLKLTYRYQWCSSNLFGFLRKSTLINNSERVVHLSVLDGLQIILPYLKAIPKPELAIW